MLQVYQNIDEHSIINKEDLCDLIHLELREDIGGLLYVPYRLKIFIGYDFMMEVHSSKALEPIFEKIEGWDLIYVNFNKLYDVLV